MRMVARDIIDNEQGQSLLLADTAANKSLMAGGGPSLYIFKIKPSWRLSTSSDKTATSKTDTEHQTMESVFSVAQQVPLFAKI